MSDHRRVVWNEGMLLSPQHFQQLDRSVGHFVAERFRAAQAFEWGLTAIEFDREALRNGRVSLIGASGVLPDGTPFRMPGDDPLPSARVVEEHFEPRRESLRIHLGLPAMRSGRRAFGEAARPGMPGPRYSEESHELPDAAGDGGTRTIGLARPNPVILFPDDALGDHDALPLAELVRSSEGGFALRDGYVPPLLQIGASDPFLRRVRSLRERLITKLNELVRERSEKGGVVDFGNTGKFLIGQIVSSYIPVLSHLVAQPRVHPESVYLVLGQLIGALSTFQTRIGPADVPPYDHEDLGGTIARLDELLDELLRAKTLEKTVRIELTKRDAFVQMGRITDERLLQPPNALYLGIRSDLDEQRLVAEAPVKVKIASDDRVDALIAANLRGVPLAHVRTPPGSLTTRSAYLYFVLEPRGEAWETVRGARNVAIYVSPDFSNVSLELLGLLE